MLFRAIDRILFPTLILLVLLQFTYAEGRLDSNVKPNRYQITLRIDSDHGSFDGLEKIEIRLPASTTAIVLHASDLNITSAVISQSNHALRGSIEMNADSKTVALRFGKEISAGSALLELHWTAKLRDDLRGLYLVKQQEGSYVFSQLYPADARLVFPCFDEPALKARFALTVVVPANLVAISNGSMAAERKEPNSDMKVVEFSETPPMSTYLLALAIGPFESISERSADVPITVWTTAGKSGLGKYAMETAAKVLPIYEDYFGIPYPYAKLDLVAVPELQFGAMENTAAIFFRETVLLVDLDQSSHSSLRWVAGSVAHEIAHQWFGDLVTMAWWDDLWLNESFASWISDKAVDMSRPEWKVSSDFVRDKNYALEEDAFRFTHPIKMPIQSPEDQQLDAITYSKGAAVLRMLESWLGEKTFRIGVRIYLRKHQYGNSTSADLWAALEESSGRPVVKVAQSWIDQPGFPLVSLSARRDSKKITIHVKQQRYLSLSTSMNSGREQLWQIPICFRYRDVEEKQSCFLLSNKEMTFNLNCRECGDWIYGNAKEIGYFYVHYDEATLSKLLDSLSHLTAEERAGLITTEWAAVRNGTCSISNFMSVLTRYKSERDRSVVQSMLVILSEINRNIISEDDRPAYSRFVEDLIGPIWLEVGWESRPQEDDDRKRLRATLLWVLASTSRSEKLSAEIDQHLASYLKDPSTVEPTLVQSLLDSAASSGSVVLYEQFLERARKASTPVEHDSFLYALCEFEDLSLARRTFDLALNVQEPVSKQDVVGVISALFLNRKSSTKAWEWTSTHWTELRAVVPPYLLSQIPQNVGETCDASIREGVQSFYKPLEDQIPDGERLVKRSLEKMDVCILRKEREKKQLSTWLQERGY